MVQSLYHLDDRGIKNLTIREFNIKTNNIEHVAKLYNPYIGGEEKTTSNANTNAIDTLVSNIRNKKKGNK